MLGGTKTVLRVLVVEDNPQDVEILERALAKYRRVKFDVVSVSSIKSCKQHLKDRPFDVVLLDYNLPGENGLALLQTVDANVPLPPVIMLTGQTDVLVARDSILFGASDYIVKDSLKPDTLGDAIREAIEKAKLEVEESSRNQDLQKLAFIDPLTGLYNRRYLTHALEKECARSARYGNNLSCLMLDVDDFKFYNDTFGHIQGDSILRQVAAIIRASVRDSDIAVRYGGDEFCVVLPETQFEAARQLAERMRYSIAAMQMVVDKRSVSITVSIGVFAPEIHTHIHPDAILDQADAALRKAKASGKNQVFPDGSRADATSRAPQLRTP